VSVASYKAMNKTRVTILKFLSNFPDWDSRKIPALSWLSYNESIRVCVRSTSRPQA